MAHAAPLVQQTPYLGHPFYEIKSTDGQIRQIPVDDVFCMKNLNPLDPYKRGLARLRPCR